MISLFQNNKNFSALKKSVPSFVLNDIYKTYILYYSYHIDIYSYARKQTKYMMEISFLRNTTKSLENNLNQAIIEIAEDNENIVAAKDIIKTLEIKISKL